MVCRNVAGGQHCNFIQVYFDGDKMLNFEEVKEFANEFGFDVKQEDNHILFFKSRNSDAHQYVYFYEENVSYLIHGMEQNEFRSRSENMFFAFYEILAPEDEKIIDLSKAEIGTIGYGLELIDGYYEPCRYILSKRFSENRTSDKVEYKKKFELIRNQFGYKAKTREVETDYSEDEDVTIYMYANFKDADKLAKKLNRPKKAANTLGVIYHE